MVAEMGSHASVEGGEGDELMVVESDVGRWAMLSTECGGGQWAMQW
jgi:hypothetical protein